MEKPNSAFPYTAELKPFQDADDAWSAELERIFGRQAGTARYQPRGQGEPGSRLRALYEERQVARIRWHDSAWIVRGVS